MDARLGTATGLLALGLIVAACTGDDDSADGTTVPSATTPATTATTEPPRPSP